MQAMVQDGYGAADELMLTEVERPTPVENQVLVHVEAASVNPLDWHIMRAKPFFIRLSEGIRQPKHAVRGVDVSGRIEAIGPDVIGFEPGDEVFGSCQGAFAEFALSRDSHLVHKPANISHEEAAAIPVAAATALEGLRDLGRLEAGHHVAVIGASGGVGTYAVQLAKVLGAEVTAVCSGRNAELVTSLGADHVIDYTQTSFTESSERYDVIFQLAGTDSPAKLRKLLHPEGTLVLSSGMGRLSGIDRIIKAMVASQFVSQRLVTWIASVTQEDLSYLSELLESGQIRSVIDRTYPLTEVAEAMQYVEDGHTRGKVVISLATPPRSEES